MRLFMWNLLLAIFWAAVSNNMTLLNLCFGFAAGYFVLLVVRRTLDDTRYFRRTYLFVAFVWFFLSELVKSTLKLAHDIITPSHRMQPGVIAVPLKAKTDLEITLLANLISLTPGTLSLDVASDRSVLYIHAMYITGKDTDAFKLQIKEQMEKRVLELLR